MARSAGVVLIRAERGQLLHSFWDKRETELFCAGPDLLVEAQQREVRNRATTEDRARHVQGVQGADRLAGKRLTGARDDVGANAKDVPVCGCVEQTSTQDSALFWVISLSVLARMITRSHSTTVRSDAKYDVRATQVTPHSSRSRFSKKPGKNCTGLGVKVHRGPRSSSSSRQRKHLSRRGASLDTASGRSARRHTRGLCGATRSASLRSRHFANFFSGDSTPRPPHLDRLWRRFPRSFARCTYLAQLILEFSKPNTGHGFNVAP